MFDLELKRIERSKKSFMLLLMYMTGLEKALITNLMQKLKKTFLLRFRDTDILGWYKQNSVIGIIFTDFNSVGHSTREVIFGKMLTALSSQIAPDQMSKIYMTFHLYPKDPENSIGSGRFDIEVGQDLARRDNANTSPSQVRKLINFVSSILALSG